MKQLFAILIFVFFFKTIYAEEPFWEILNAPYAGAVTDIICAQGDTLYAYGENGIFRSVDHAENWMQIKKGKTTSLAVNSKNEIIATSCWSNSSYYESYLVKSINGGITWDTLSSIWEWSNAKYEYYNHIIDIKFDHRDQLYVASSYWPNSYDDSTLYKMLYSDDMGKSWNSIDSIYMVPSRIRGIYPYKNGHLAVKRILTVEGSQNDETAEYISITTDNGITWTDISFKTVRSDEFVDLVYLSENKIFVLYFCSFHFTSNGGESWERILVPDSSLYSSSILIKDENTIYIGKSFNGNLYYTSDRGNSWSDVKDSVFVLNLREDSSGNMYSTHRWGIKKSVNGGKAFMNSSKGYINISSWLFDIAFDRSGDVYFGYDGIYKSPDNGRSWERILKDDRSFVEMLGLDDGSILASVSAEKKFYRSTDEGKNWELWSEVNFPIWDFVQNRRGILFAIPHRSYVFRSTDRGKTWEYLTNSKAGEAIAINNQDDVITANYAYSGGIFISTDDGETWVKTHQYEPEEVPFEFKTLIFHPRKKLGFGNTSWGYFYKTYDNGFSWTGDRYGSRPGGKYHEMAVDSLGNFWAGYYRSTNDGETWEAVESGLDPTHRETIAMGVSPDGYIFLATRYGGLYRSKERYVSVEEPPIYSNIILNQNVPNPFTENTEITYSLDKPGYVQLSIFDILGIKVDEPVNRRQYAGTHTVTISNNNYPQGLYFYTLKTGGNSITKKMLIIK